MLINLINWEIENGLNTIKSIFDFQSCFFAFSCIYLGAQSRFIVHSSYMHEQWVPIKISFKKFPVNFLCLQVEEWLRVQSFYLYIYQLWMIALPSAYILCHACSLFNILFYTFLYETPCMTLSFLLGVELKCFDMLIGRKDGKQIAKLLAWFANNTIQICIREFKKCAIFLFQIAM